MDIATITLEFFSDTKEHLKSLEHALKRVHDVGVSLIEPREASAPTLVAISIEKSGERGEQAAQGVAQTLYTFIHDPTSQGQKQIFLFTIEGDRVDAETLSQEQLQEIIVAAKAGEQA
ncbi:MAG TPA: hypothetical protein VFA41_01870 [Ktedonobacteraceae bacterium]|jgi:hypothetical protein|nr:hypothetical protein [Ktedonobacteraceae bacterium]